MPHASPEFEARVHELLDNRRAPEDDPQLQSQAALAPDDKCLLVGQQLMLDGLEMSEIPELPADFAQRCVAAVADEVVADKVDATPTVTSARRMHIWQISAAAVCAALALAAVIPLWNWAAGDRSPSVVENLPAEIPEQPALENFAVDEEPDQDESSQLPDQSPDAGETDSSEGIAQTDEPQEGPYVNDGEPNYEDLYAAIRDLQKRIPAPNGDADLLALRPQWVDDMATGLRPVADSMGGAFNALRRNLPPSPKADGAEKPQAWLSSGDAKYLT